MSGDSALRLEGVELARGDVAVLRGVDLALAPGEVLGLAGRNGAGKTTLLRVASGVLAPDRGRVLVGGRDAAGLSRRDYARAVAVVPQETAIPFAFTVGEVVLMGRAPHLGLLGFEREVDRAAAADALGRLGLGALAERSILEVSGGERQLAVVARALAQDAPVLLLDEPTAHLDLTHRLRVLALARSLADEGRSILVVSHDLALVARFCDRLALLRDGRVEVGAPDAMLTPERLLETFGLRAEILRSADGSAVVVPHLAQES